jgi:hypothetical protein
MSKSSARNRLRFDRRRTRQFVALSVAAVLFMSLGVALATAPQSGAHLFEKTGNGKNWYFGGRTVGSEGQDSEKVDPVTLIFHGGNQPHIYTNQFVDGKLQTFIPDMAPGCIPTTAGCITIPCNGRQRMVWNNLNGNRNSDKEDINRSTSDTCEDQVHIRLWDDHEHAQQFPSGTHTEFSWSVGSVHKEERCPIPPVPIFNPLTQSWHLQFFCPHHRISTFERQARNIASKFDSNDNWCSDRKWRFLPGSMGANGDKSSIDYSDGYLTEIIHDDNC